MKWKFLNTGLNSGRFNMDFDLDLTTNLQPDEAILRLYRWEPFCISLGANQSEESLLADKVREDGLDIVKRPTGGRAILHSDELTYSVIFHLGNKYSVKELYKEINLALKKGISLFDRSLNRLELEYSQPNFHQFYKQEKGMVCFAVAARNEINFDGKKLVGSAQRKIGDTLLQHGSILCGDYHKRIIDYLNVDNKSLQTIKNEIDNTTISLSEILNMEIDYNKLAGSIKKGFEIYFNNKFEKAEAEYYLHNIMDNKNEY
ncbi:octanoyltransferase LipM [bacterium BMS3Abin03]|nr:octanoyltransferase LipM [bacterium BMS3Abin03]